MEALFFLIAVKIDVKIFITDVNRLDAETSMLA